MSFEDKEQDQSRLVAERIARRLSQQHVAADTGRKEAGESVGEVAELRATLRELQKRLAHVESHITHDEDCDAAAKTTNGNFNEQSSPANSKFNTQISKPASPAPQQRAPFLSGVYVPATHPSTERFGIDEASAVSELVDFFENAKTCELEPGGKPCDHCAMCSSRGF